MAEKIAGVLRHGLRPARLAFDPLEVELQSLAMWRTLAAEPAAIGDRQSPVMGDVSDQAVAGGRSAFVFLNR
jgi:hypothetical protein